MLLLFLGQVNPPGFQITERIVTAGNNPNFSERNALELTGNVSQKT